MGLQLNVSNSLFQLVKHLVVNLQKPLPSIFQPHFVVTQTMGMNNWLKIQIANHLGITANCQFLKPNDIINQVYFLLDGPRENMLSADSLQWLLFGLLDDPNFKRRYPIIAQYYEGQEDIKRMALAEKVADLFDQYQIYRSETIREWNLLDEPSTDESNWQKHLWIEARNRIGGKMPDKTKIGKFITDSLKNPSQQQKLKQRITQIEFFGISIITAYHLEVFHELAKYINITFNILNPAPSIYWFYDKSPTQLARWNSKKRQEERSNKKQEELDNIEGNALLTNWGKVIQDTFGLFFTDENFLNEYQDEGIEPDPKCLLSKIQHDIYNNSIDSDRNQLNLQDINDGSISINSCYTPVREVEVLYNYLVHLVNQHPNQLSPRDIVVMVSDIDAYAPYIKAIFKSAPYTFPFTIADESIQSTDGLIGALHAFLALNDENFKAEDVVQLLEWSYIRNRFKITDLELIRKIVNEANIRFGIQGDILDDTIHVSWINGLNRIIYGICMIGDEEYQLDEYSFFPLDQVEGEQAFELIRFSHFVKVLIQGIEEQQKNRTLIEWGEYMLQVVSQIIFQSENEEDADNELIINYVRKLNLISENIQEKVSFSVFKHNFLNSISGETRTGNFASGGITFCSLIPMRSIPFKIVALLGLGFDKFPRKETSSSFNLMQQNKKRGDRNIKENDKHLFLETILSAQEHLYISYIGKNTKDNSIMPPSAIVDELIDYIITGVAADSAADYEESDIRKKLITEHPLHNYSQQPKGTFNYLATANKPSDVINELATEPNSPQPTGEVTIKDFINFFKNPFEHYHNKTLSIYYRQEDVLLRETEYFELDRLQEWKIKQDFLFLKDDEVAIYIDKGIKMGRLPLKNISKILVNNLYENLGAIKKMVQETINDGEERNIVINLEIGNTIISGNINRVFDDKIILVSFSKHDTKYILEAYIHHLLATASGENVDSYYISNENQCVSIISKDEITKEKAKEILSELLDFYYLGSKKPFVFYPKFENEPDKLVKYDFTKYKKMFEGILKPFGRTFDDPYILNEYRAGFFDNEEVFNEYLKNSELIFSNAFRLFKKLD